MIVIEAGGGSNPPVTSLPSWWGGQGPHLRQPYLTKKGQPSNLNSCCSSPTNLNFCHFNF
eukprot:627798-Ditylum_brightwellii.AAC.1